jgi:hypothetical protein
MQEKAPKKFDRVERHEALAIASLVILPPERHLTIITSEEPPIGDGHPMRVAGQVAQNPLWSGQWRLGIDHPLRLLQGPQELGPLCGRVPSLVLQAETLLGGRLLQPCQERAAKYPTEDTDREKEALATGDPGGAIQRESPGWDQAMDVGMMMEGLAPGMQDPEKADFGA